MHFMVCGPPLTFGLHGRKALRLSRTSGRRARFHAHDIGRIERFHGVVEFACRAELDEPFRNFLSSHDQSPDRNLARLRLRPTGCIEALSLGDMPPAVVLAGAVIAISECPRSGAASR